MHNDLAPASALRQQATVLAAAAGPPELDLQQAQRLSRRVELLTSSGARRKELSATKRANRSTVDEIATWLGVSRSTMSRLLEETPLRGGEKRADKGGVGKRHDHGTGRRRHAGAGVRNRSNPHRQSARIAQTLETAS